MQKKKKRNQQEIIEQRGASKMANSRSTTKRDKRSRKDLTPLDMDRSVICGRFGFEVSEAYKLLRTNLEFTVIDKKCKIIGITSAGKGEAKSTTAINLAYTEG